jgi:hypothetical protein
MAKQAGFVEMPETPYGNSKLETFAKLVEERVQVKLFCDGVGGAVVAEREACAEICDRFQARGMQPAECAGAIRARGEA